MKALLLGFVLGFSVAAKANTTATEELWKGSPYEQKVSLALIQGIGFPNGPIAYAVNGYLGFKILNRGFVPDINNQVYGEICFGGLFGGGGGTQFGLQLRWDLHKDYLWTFYGVGGLGVGVYGTAPASTTHFFPRIGIGGLWNLFEGMSFRAEVTESLIGIGVATAF